MVNEPQWELHRGRWRRISRWQHGLVRRWRGGGPGADVPVHTDEEKTGPVLRYAVPDRVEQDIANLVPLACQLGSSFPRHVPAVDRQHPGYVLHDKCPGLPFLHCLDESAIQLIARVTRETVLIQAVELGAPDDGKPLAWGATDDDIRRGFATDDLGDSHVFQVEVFSWHHDGRVIRLEVLEVGPESTACRL